MHFWAIFTVLVIILILLYFSIQDFKKLSYEDQGSVWLSISFVFCSSADPKPKIKITVRVIHTLVITKVSWCKHGWDEIKCTILANFYIMHFSPCFRRCFGKNTIFLFFLYKSLVIGGNFTFAIEKWSLANSRDYDHENRTFILCFDSKYLISWGKLIVKF